ncbi:hypothetical protein FOZ63_018107, partial [Perkinsus olseni]
CRILFNSCACGLVYVDDLLWAFPSVHFATSLSLLLTLQLCMGFGFSWHKCTFHHNANFIGYNIDTITHTDSTHFKIWIPSEKVNKVQRDISTIQQTRLVTLDVIEPLIGRLLFCTNVEPWLRTYLCPLYAVQRVLSTRRNRRGRLINSVQLTFSFSLVLQWWLTTISSRLSTSIRPRVPPDVYDVLVSDASTSAIAAVVLTHSSEAFFSRLPLSALRQVWSDLFPHSLPCANIVFLEMTAIALA